MKGDREKGGHKEREKKDILLFPLPHALRLCFVDDVVQLLYFSLLKLKINIYSKILTIADYSIYFLFLSLFFFFFLLLFKVIVVL